MESKSRARYGGWELRPRWRIELGKQKLHSILKLKTNRNILDQFQKYDDENKKKQNLFPFPK